ncbi:MAG: glucose 1-dehydrogenase [Elusimicrobia bacterium]|nr:glucose 1-dehydrogenase [Elusimicrobiota bacterium]MBD3412336.1 glucose 1-dehydrogenase [Elusimicrobiota bacterium]
MKRVQNRIAVVTGGSLGIGKAAALLLAQEGAQVAVTDIKDDEGKKTVQEIEKQGGNGAFWHLDVGKEDEVSRVLKLINDRWGGIHVLVNNAGISGANKPTHEVSEDEWDRVMRINVKGVFFCTKYAVPYLQKSGGGSIINLSSIYGIVGAPDIPPYHASKGAVRLMTKTDALLYADKNIRVNSIHPGYIWTPLVADMAQESGKPEDFRQKLDDLHPIGHVGEPDDVAYGIVYFASDESKFITGSELVIDGGYTAR